MVMVMVVMATMVATVVMVMARQILHHSMDLPLIVETVQKSKSAGDVTT